MIGMICLFHITGMSLREAHQKAVETAAFVCTQEGAWPP